MTNLKTVINFEITRNLKKPTFWLAAILIPLLLIGYIFLAGANGINAAQIAEQGTATTDLSLSILDESGILAKSTDPTLAAMQKIPTKNQGINAVKSRTTNVFYYLPPDFTTTKTAEIYASTDNTTLFTNYESPLRTILATTAIDNVTPADLIILTGDYQINTTNFTPSGAEHNILAAAIIPIMALAIFYILICMFGNRLTMAVVEEKENRISEMILTSLNPTDLIIGKIISLITLGFIQVIILTLPILIILALAPTLSAITLPAITLDPYTIITSIILLITSYFLFTGLCVTVGTLVPTAKDAASYSSVFMILVILPLFFLSDFMTSDPTPITQALTFFPLSAPVALMLRNAFGTLPPLELILGITILIISSALIIKLAVYIFKRSAIDFTSKISLRTLITKGPRTTWH